MAESEISFWINGGYHSKEWVWAWIFENFLEINTMVLIFNSQRGEILLDKKQVFHYQFIYILWILTYLKSKRIQRNKIMNAHKSYCIESVILLRFQRIWNWSINILIILFFFFEWEFLPNITRHPLRPRMSFSEFYVYSLKLIFPIVLKSLRSVRFEFYGIRLVSGVAWENTISIKISF